MKFVPAGVFERDTGNGQIVPVVIKQPRFGGNDFGVKILRSHGRFRTRHRLID